MQAVHVYSTKSRFYTSADQLQHFKTAYFDHVPAHGQHTL